jgi:hypothetical protein
MSTRCAIARVVADHWEGIYSHFDGYPEWMGPHLWKLLHETYNGDVQRMLAYLIDEHPGGWSTPGEECYCHPRRDRVPEPDGGRRTEFDENWDLEYVWIFGDRVLTVAGVQVPLDGPEPDWATLEAAEGES